MDGTLKGTTTPGQSAIATLWQQKDNFTLSKALEMESHL